MYIQTPKRYRGTQRRRVFSCGRILFSTVMLILIIIGIGLYYNRQLFQPYVVHMAETAMVDAGNWQATQFAPTPVPTNDPTRTLIDADNDWSRGRINLALQSYNEVLDTLPNNVQVYSRITEAYLTRGNIPDALKAAENTVTADPFSADAWTTRSLAYSWEGNYAEGIASAQQALAINPNNVSAIAFLAYAYWQGGQSNLAEIRATDAINADPNRWEGYWVRGLVRENDSFDFEGAQEDYKMAYQLAQEMGQNPALAGVAATGVARIQVQYNDYNGAVATLNASLELDPNNADVLYSLGWIEFTYVGDYAQAQEVLLDCTQAAPENYRCWYFLGRARDKQGDQEGALQAFKTAIDLNAPVARYYWWAAEMAKALGDCSQAATYLEKGYGMVTGTVSINGSPAVDSGDKDLKDAFDYSISICGVNITQPTQAEATQEAGG